MQTDCEVSFFVCVLLYYKFLSHFGANIKKKQINDTTATKAEDPTKRYYRAFPALSNRHFGDEGADTATMSSSLTWPEVMGSGRAGDGGTGQGGGAADGEICGDSSGVRGGIAGGGGSGGNAAAGVKRKTKRRRNNGELDTHFFLFFSPILILISIVLLMIRVQ